MGGEGQATNGRGTDGASSKARHTRRRTTIRWCRRRYCLDFVFYRRIPDGRSGGTREAVPVDAVENPPPGQGLRESAGLEFVNAVDEFDDENTGHLSHDT